MGEKLERLEGLARLTRGDSEEGRLKLLREVADLFMEAPETLNPTEVAYFGEIMTQLMDKVETMVRQHLSETIAEVANAPRSLVVKLANDKIDVATPVLTHSPALGDDDLVKIVQTKSQDHLKAISQRPMVAEKVTDVLVVKGDDEVLETLADNVGARFSEGGMETMVVRADGNESLSQSLMKRQDVPDDMAGAAFWRVSWAIRQQILDAEPGLDEAQITVLMEETEKWFKAQETEHKLTPAESFIHRKQILGQLDNNFLLQLIREKKVPEFVAGIARLARIDHEMAEQAVFDLAGEKMAVVFKSLDMDFDMFGEILMLTNFDGSRSQEDTGALLDIYARISTDAAKRAMRFFKTRRSMKKKVGDGIRAVT